MTELLVIIVSAALVNNLLLDYALGADPALAFSRRLDVAIGLTLSLIFLIPVTTAFAYLIESYWLDAYGLGYLRNLCFVISIFLVMYVFKRVFAASKTILRDTTQVFYPIAAINTAVLGVMLLNQRYSDGFIDSIFFGLGSALGFAIVLILLTGIRQRLDTIDVPILFKGTPIALISMGLVAMAFMGFTGLTQT